MEEKRFSSPQEVLAYVTEHMDDVDAIEIAESPIELTNQVTGEARLLSGILKCCNGEFFLGPDDIDLLIKSGVADRLGTRMFYSTRFE